MFVPVTGQYGVGQRTDNMAKLLLLLAMAAAAQAWVLPPEYTRTKLGDSIDKASLQVLKVTYEQAKDNKNVVSSPLSLMVLLALYNNGAGAATKAEIAQFLGSADAKEASDSFRQLSEEFSDMNPEYLTLANKIYLSSNYELDDKFALTARSYRSEVENIDFTKSAAAADTINKWASEKTKGNIKEPISKDGLDPQTVMGLFNVIYFKGHWHVPFKTEDTKDEDFHVTKTEVVKKPMMQLKQSLYYHESEALGARLLELPYKEEGFRMVIVLPNEVDGLPSVLAKATEKGLLSDVFELSPAGRDVILKLPKFDIKSKLDFKSILPKIGVSKLFSEGASGLAKNETVVVSKAFQEAFIKVNEEGATAGAFTGLLVIAESAILEEPEPIQFTVDRPFLYAILYQDKVLFTGTHTQ